MLVTLMILGPKHVAQVYLPVGVWLLLCHF